MALHSLALPENARRRGGGRFSLPHALTGLGWLIIGLAIAAYALIFLSGWGDAKPTWLVTAFLCSAASLGLAFRARWARFLISAIALGGAALFGFVTLAAVFNGELLWWPGPLYIFVGAVFILFCAWTLFFTIALWADYQPVARGAA